MFSLGRLDDVVAAFALYFALLVLFSPILTPGYLSVYSRLYL